MLKYVLVANICIFAVKNKPQEVRETFSRYYGQLRISPVSADNYFSVFALPYSTMAVRHIGIREVR